jgi:hypothetical protein
MKRIGKTIVADHEPELPQALSSKKLPGKLHCHFKFEERFLYIGRIPEVTWAMLVWRMTPFAAY